MKSIRLTITLLALMAFAVGATAQKREHILMDSNWKFAFGNAASPAKDFGCGTEYFNYLTKANSIHNEGPYSAKFDDSNWKSVDLPHDFVVDLPFNGDASHSHGYKTVGYKYPETSVGWYRKVFKMGKDDWGKHIELQLDGVFRDSRVWVNGFYLGGEPSGYTSRVYDISEYLHYGDSTNVVCVRSDATLEEGWFYEGGGIYRHVWLNKSDAMHVATYGTFVRADVNEALTEAKVSIDTKVKNSSLKSHTYILRHALLDAEGKVVVTADDTHAVSLQAKAEHVSTSSFSVKNPHLWGIDNPYLYKVRTEVVCGNEVVDTYITTTGFRRYHFDHDKGLFLNGKHVKLKGVNMHQDHAGVGAGIPDALQEYRLAKLKEFGCNAYRASHNPMTPEMIDACDRLGIIVVEENRLTGVNDYQIGQLTRMIERDRNHPSILFWSVGNEEWGIEWNSFGERIAASMQEYCHRLDPTRLVTVASASGPTIVVPVDVAGYNYIMQNPVEEHRANYPTRCAMGTEETSGCGTRGCYFDDKENGHMTAINRHPEGKDNALNCIERGWKFYNERDYLGGVFYWTGFDYRGEPNPLSYPATGSEFGILDYCGFPKDEAFYLKSWWTDTPTLHILPHWNLQGHEGESVDVWVYSNCDEVELSVNGKSMGKKAMPKDGHLSWEVTYQPGTVKATGYKKGKAIINEQIATTMPASKFTVTSEYYPLQDDGRDLHVCTIRQLDKKGRFVPDACEEMEITVDGDIRILGVGNGDPAYRDNERPTDADARTYRVKTFNGLAQVLIQNKSCGMAGHGSITVKGKNGAVVHKL